MLLRVGSIEFAFEGFLNPIIREKSCFERVFDKLQLTRHPILYFQIDYCSKRFYQCSAYSYCSLIALGGLTRTLSICPMRREIILLLFAATIYSFCSLGMFDCFSATRRYTFRGKRAYIVVFCQICLSLPRGKRNKLH